MRRTTTSLIFGAPVESWDIPITGKTNGAFRLDIIAQQAGTPGRIAAR